MFARIKKSGINEYLQLVENRWEEGKVRQHVIATLGRLDELRKNGKLEQAVDSLGQFCEKAMVLAIKKKQPDVRSVVYRVGPSVILERLWYEIGIKEAIKKLLVGREYKFDVERAIYLTVLHRLFVSGSDRSCEKWQKKYRIGGIEKLSLHHLYRGMAWLGGLVRTDKKSEGILVKDEIEERLFEKRRDIFTELELAFYDTTSLHFEGEGGESLGQRGRSKAHRPDLKQMILGVVIDGEGKPICSQMWPGNVTDVKTLIPISERLRKRFLIKKICIVADRGMICRKAMEKLKSPEYGWGYILGVKLRQQKEEIRKKIMEDKGCFEEIYPARNKAKDPSPLKVKEVKIDKQRYIICYNAEQARKDVHTREAIIKDLREKVIAERKSLIGNKGYRKYLQINKKSLQIDEDKIKTEAQYDGLWVITTNTELSAKDVALKYKQLWRIEKIFRDSKSLLKTRPVFHKYDRTIRGHVFCSFLALVIKEELERRLEKAGCDFEWADIKQGLKALEETEVTYQGKTFIIRSAPEGVCGKIFQTVGVALPPTIREK